MTQLPTRHHRPARPSAAIAAPVSALAVAGVVLLALNMRTAIAEIPPVLPDLGLASAGQSVLATVPVGCFGLAARGAPALRARLGEERGLLLVLVVLLGGVIVRAAWPGGGLFP